MKRSLALTAASLALLGILGTLVPAAAADSSQTNYETAIRSVYGSQYPITGKLDLQIFPDGVLRGYYHPSFNKAFVPVTGGRDGDYIWFDIGPAAADLGFGNGGGKLHMVGNVDKDGTIHGQVWQVYAGDSGLAIGSGSPGAPAGAGPDGQGQTGDQYTFTAKPVMEKTASQ